MEAKIAALVQDHLYIASYMARKIKNNALTYEDLYQEGCIGLIKAAEKFDDSRGVKFSTYANWWVKQAIYDALTSKSRTIRLPSHIVSLKLKIFKFIENFILTTGYEPDNELIAKELRVNKYQVEEILNFNTEYTGDWEVSEEVVEDQVEAEDTMSHVLTAVDCLNSKEKLIIAMKFGLLTQV
jgi:RNA polymerase primary sigma factor